MSSGAHTPADDAFQGVWRKLRVCHQNAIQELEAKVSKLKHERCLDAQRLELFFTRNQKLKEQNKKLQDAISLMEERLHAGECDRCAVLQKKVKDKQDQNLHLINKLETERNSLKDENRKLRTELKKLKLSRSEVDQASSPEQEEGIIPDSPVLQSSVPVINKLKKSRNIDKVKHVRYAETPPPHANNSLFIVMKKESVVQNSGIVEVLVPNTCEMDAFSYSDDMDLNVDEVIAETCRLEALERRTEKAAGQKCSPIKYSFCLNPDLTTEASPSLLPRFKRFSENSSINSAKRKKEESEQEEDNPSKQMENKQCDQLKQTSTSSSSQSVKDHLDNKVQSTQTLDQKPDGSCTSPEFKKPNIRRKDSCVMVNTSHDQHEEAEREPDLEGPWITLSLHGNEWREDEQQEEHRRGELADTDCTWVSHSLLEAQEENTPDRGVSGLGRKANDSLDMMFDTTTYGEYKSCNISHSGQSQPCEEEDDGEEASKLEDPPENTMSPKKHNAQPKFPYVVAIRKKEERQKLKGTTCKECEIYYAHLPEEEKQKKLSACSRHRFLYIPPSTPENFWEVGFPSTQTCIERGYIKLETNPQTRPRRRQPFNALFSPKRKLQES